MPRSSLPILIVTGDERGARDLSHVLSDAGFQLLQVASLRAAVERAPEALRLVLIDLVAGEDASQELFRQLRARTDAPIMVVAGPGLDGDPVQILSQGADDYLVRPFSPEELIARIRARLRRPTLERGGQVGPEGLEIDSSGRRVTVRGKAVDLTRVESDLLFAAGRRPRNVVARRALVEGVLDPDRDGGERALDVHVSRLRRKLGRAGADIVTVRGVGYRFDPSPDSVTGGE